MKIVILENIRSLHNVGSVFRTCDGAGWDRVLLGGYTGCPPDRRIEKVSLGAEKFITWEQSGSVPEMIKKLKKQGFEIIALEQTPKSEILFEMDFKNPNIALVLGNEVEGISPETLKHCDRHAEIPMYGQKSSLNVAIAAGIAMYEIHEKMI